METDTLGSSLSSISPGGKGDGCVLLIFLCHFLNDIHFFSLFFFFWMWIIFKVFIEFVTLSFFFFGIEASGILVP